MIKIRKAAARGETKLDWLESWHTFSFDQYYDPEHVHFRSLRVINEDFVAPGAGFPTHPHRDMEIITYVLKGALEHRDSLGTGSVIRPGEVQRMSAGSGITHSEYNPSPDEAVHLLQIWLLPERRGLTPGYQQRTISREPGQGFQLVAAREGGNEALTVHQDVELFVALARAGEELDYRLKADRHGWLQLARGEINLNGNLLRAGDAAAISNETGLQITVNSDAEMLLFDLA
jgi:quercetin 2,3-dioxygenase